MVIPEPFFEIEDEVTWYPEDYRLSNGSPLLVNEMPMGVIMAREYSQIFKSDTPCWWYTLCIGRFSTSEVLERELLPYWFRPREVPAFKGIPTLDIYLIATKAFHAQKGDPERWNNG